MVKYSMVLGSTAWDYTYDNMETFTADTGYGAADLVGPIVALDHMITFMLTANTTEISSEVSLQIYRSYQ